MKIYIAGKIPKGTAAINAPDWRAEFLAPFKSLGVELLSAEGPELDERLPLTIVGHDCHQISIADLIIVNAAEKLGVGTAQEMLIAKYFTKPVVTILPKNTHHRRSDLLMNDITVADWIHPFIYATSDLIIEDSSGLTDILSGNIQLPPPKGIDIIDTSITAYQEWFASHGHR